MEYEMKPLTHAAKSNARQFSSHPLDNDSNETRIPPFLNEYPREFILASSRQDESLPDLSNSFGRELFSSDVNASHLYNPTAMSAATMSAPQLWNTFSPSIFQQAFEHPSSIFNVYPGQSLACHGAVNGMISSAPEWTSETVAFWEPIFTSDTTYTPRYGETAFRKQKNELIEFASTFVERLFNCNTNHSGITLNKFLARVIQTTRISAATLVTAFLFLTRLKKRHPKCKGSDGSAQRLMLAALILAAKSMYDDTYDNTAWATVSSGLFQLPQVNQMEMELLYFLDFNLYIKPQEWDTFCDDIAQELQYQETRKLNKRLAELRDVKAPNGNYGFDEVPLSTSNLVLSTHTPLSAAAAAGHFHVNTNLNRNKNTHITMAQQPAVAAAADGIDIFQQSQPHFVNASTFDQKYCAPHQNISQSSYTNIQVSLLPDPLANLYTHDPSSSASLAAQLASIYSSASAPELQRLSQDLTDVANTTWMQSEYPGNLRRTMSGPSYVNADGFNLDASLNRTQYPLQD